MLNLAKQKSMTYADISNLCEILRDTKCWLKEINLSSNHQALPKGLLLVLFAIRKNKYLEILKANNCVLSSEIFESLKSLIA